MVGFVPLFKLLDFFLNLLFFFSLYLIIFYLSLFRKSNFLNIFVPKCFGFSLLKLIVFLPDNLLNFFLIFFLDFFQIYLWFLPNFDWISSWKLIGFLLIISCLWSWREAVVVWCGSVGHELCRRRLCFCSHPSWFTTTLSTAPHPARKKGPKHINMLHKSKTNWKLVGLNKLALLCHLKLKSENL